MSVRWNRLDAVANLILDRPDKRNAMSAEMVAEALDLLTDEQGLIGVRALIVSGEGSGFCAGSDLSGLSIMDADEREQFEHQSGKLARRIADLPIPVIAKVRGFAIGGGLTLAAACDLIISHADSKWSLPEVPIGLFPAWGLGYLAARTGTPTARRLSFGIDTLSGSEAYDAGLVDILVDAANIDNAANSTAERLAALPIDQARAVKSYFCLGAQDTADARANALFKECARTSPAARTFERFSSR